MNYEEESKELLRAAFQLMNKQNKSHYVLNTLEQTVMLDPDCEVDGMALLDMIKEVLEDNNVDPYEMDNDNIYC